MRTDAHTVAGCSALGTALVFAVGVALMVVSGVESLIPDSGTAALAWVAQVRSGGDTFAAGGWLVVVGGILALVAFVGFYLVLASRGKKLTVATSLAVLALTLVTISHLIPLAMARQLAQGYMAADPASRAGQALLIETLADLSQVLNVTGDVVLWGVVLPLFAYATLKLRVVPRWVAWLGLGTTVFGGWLGLIGIFIPAIDVSFLGFVAFFVWLAAMGISLLRRAGRDTAVSAENA